MNPQSPKPRVKAKKKTRKSQSSSLKRTDFEDFDWQLLQPAPVVGVDEVGRGCVAGPVYAAAVILDETKNFSAFTDSKLLSEERRETLYSQIITDHKVGLGFATVQEISCLNIFKASLLAMRRAVLQLKLSRGHLIIDGKFGIEPVKGLLQTTLIKGDLRAAPVAAASIVAKVIRDRLLIEMAQKYPQYGFERHKGYHTKEHQEAIRKHGPCDIHRPTFAGIREYL